jgi:hypothetical protein
MADMSLTGSDPAVVFMVSAGLVYEVVAAACSSPQTAEINADTRSDTLMKWVKIGLAQAALFVAIAVLLADGNKRKLAAFGGGMLAGTIMAVCYIHARAAGLRSDDPGTES